MLFNLWFNEVNRTNIVRKIPELNVVATRLSETMRDAQAPHASDMSTKPGDPYPPMSSDMPCPLAPAPTNEDHSEIAQLMLMFSESE